MGRETFWGRIFIFLWLLLGFSSAHATDISAEVREGEAFFFKALHGDKRAVRKAQRRFRAAEQKHPGHPLVTAYQGALLALQARHASRLLEKNRFADQSLVKVDAAQKALLKYKNDVVIVLKTKLVIARTLVNLPPFFNRLVEGRKVIDELIEDKFFSIMPESFRLASYMTAAEYANKQRQPMDYEQYLMLIADTAPSSWQAARARQTLRRIDHARSEKFRRSKPGENYVYPSVAADDR